MAFSYFRSRESVKLKQITVGQRADVVTSRKEGKQEGGAGISRVCVCRVGRDRAVILDF